MQCGDQARRPRHTLGFWRQFGSQLAIASVGTAVALYQVNVFHGENGWEVAATEATEIDECPKALRAELVGRTNIEAAGTSLTTAPRVDYDTVMTTPATVSGLASVIQARQLRSLDGVYEVHNVAGMGVSWVPPQYA